MYQIDHNLSVKIILKDKRVPYYEFRIALSNIFTIPYLVNKNEESKNVNLILVRFIDDS